MSEADVAVSSSVSNRSKPKMIDAIGAARKFVSDLTRLPIDSLALCKEKDEGGWVIVFDVIESPARMGDNDLLSSYEIYLDSYLSMTHFARQRRYHREDRDQE